MSFTQESCIDETGKAENSKLNLVKLIQLKDLVCIPEIIKIKLGEKHEKSKSFKCKHLCCLSDKSTDTDHSWTTESADVLSEKH